jgi:hypothetical protein
MERRDREEPKWTKFNTERLDPKVTLLYNDKLEPNLE